MKRSFLSLFLVLLLCLTGCKSSVSPVAENFSCAFTATYKEIQLAGNLERGAVGTLTVTLTAPPSLAGLICRLENEDITLTLGDLEYKTAVIPAAAVPTVLRDMLDALSRGATEGAAAEFTGMAGTYGFTARVAPDSGVLQAVSVPDASLEIEFQNIEEQNS